MSSHQRKDRSHFRRLRSPTSRLYRGHRRHFSLKARRWAAIQMRVRIHQSKQAVLWPPWAASWRDKRRLPLRKRTALAINNRSNIYRSKIYRKWKIDAQTSIEFHRILWGSMESKIDRRSIAHRLKIYRNPHGENRRGIYGTSSKIHPTEIHRTSYEY